MIPLTIGYILGETCPNEKKKYFILFVDTFLGKLIRAIHVLKNC